MIPKSKWLFVLVLVLLALFGVPGSSLAAAPGPSGTAVLATVTPAPGPPDALRESLVTVQGQQQRMWQRMGPEGVFGSGDDGVTWQPANSGFSSVSGISIFKGKAYVASDFSFYVWLPGGSDWQAVENPFGPTMILSVAADAGYLYAACWRAGTAVGSGRSSWLTSLRR